MKRLVAFVAMVIAYSAFISIAPVSANRLGPQRKQTRRPVQRPKAQPARINYSQFSHGTHVGAQKLECNSCHAFPTKNWKEVRKGDTAFPDVAEFPEHSACLACHRPQFFAREKPAPAICVNCHVGVTPRDTARFLFPSLGDVADSKLKIREGKSEFGVAFPHDKHIDVVGSNRPGFDGPGPSPFVAASWIVSQKPPAPPKSCPVCHQVYLAQGDSSEEYVTKPPKTVGDNFWLKKGTFQTIPNSHTVCFSCHNADSGIPPDSKDCHVCHQLLKPDQNLKSDFDLKLAADMGADKTHLRAWSRRMSAGAFRHEGGEHPNLDCTGCHSIATMNTVDPTTLKVAVKSCGGAEGCHITPTTDDGGALNFEVDQKKAKADFVCTKCHVVFGKEAAPASHVAALPTAAIK